ncbi:MAG TPA: ABC transporter permease [Candidatus Acidoferrales bacterium]|jgi:lipoprotein-releasing system permease protein|nr:ABC transporter permease [Candidatus Acidoferrales bacterium]
MRFAWLLARRYLRSPNRPAVLRLVTLLAVVGVASGVATLVIALAMNSGFRTTLQDRLLGVTAHVTLSRAGSEALSNYAQLADRLSRIPGVKAVAPAIYITVLLSSGGRAHGVVVKGIDPAMEAKRNEALQRVIQGSASFSPDSEGFDSVVLGKMLANDLNLRPNDYVTLTSPAGHMTPFGMIPRSARFRISGIFDSGFYDYDANWAFVTLHAAQKLAGVGDVASVLEFRISDVDRAEQMARELVTDAGKEYTTTTWMDENRALFRALSLEKLVTALFIGLITFVAGLNILVVLAMTVSDRAHDIAVLMAMGARRRQIRRIFVLLGIAVGGFGTAVGLAAGYSLAWAAGAYKLIPLDPQIYSVPFVPFQPNPADALWITAAALAISIASTLVPARSASRIQPVELLRYE